MWICPKCETINQDGDMKCYVCSCTFAEFEEYRLNRIALEAQRKKEDEAAIKLDPEKIMQSLDNASDYGKKAPAFKVKPLAAKEKTSADKVKVPADKGKAPAARSETPDKKSIDVDIIEAEYKKETEKRSKSKLRKVLNVILVIAIIIYIGFIVYELGVNACYAEPDPSYEAGCTEITEQELVIQCQNGMICMDIF